MGEGLTLAGSLCKPATIVFGKSVGRGTGTDSTSGTHGMACKQVYSEVGTSVCAQPSHPCKTCIQGSWRKCAGMHAPCAITSILCKHFCSVQAHGNDNPAYVHYLPCIGTWLQRDDVIPRGCPTPAAACHFGLSLHAPLVTGVLRQCLAISQVAMSACVVQTSPLPPQLKASGVQDKVHVCTSPCINLTHSHSFKLTLSYAC